MNWPRMCSTPLLLSACLCPPQGEPGYPGYDGLPGVIGYPGYEGHQGLPGEKVTRFKQMVEFLQVLSSAPFYSQHRWHQHISASCYSHKCLRIFLLLCRQGELGPPGTPGLKGSLVRLMIQPSIIIYLYEPDSVQIKWLKDPLHEGKHQSLCILQGHPGKPGFPGPPGLPVRTII